MSKVALTVVAICAGLSSAVAAGAATVDQFTSAWFFGDSLTDPGNLYRDIGVPPPPYYQGRTTNGRVWAEYIADDFTAKGLANHNYAYAYADAVKNVDTRFGLYQVPDLPDQIADFAAHATPGRLGRRPVALLWFGANDLFDAFPTATSAADVVTAATGAANAVTGGITALKGYGIEHFLVLNLPPIEATPAFSGSPSGALLAKIGTDTFNATLAANILGLDPALAVTSVDVHAELLKVIANPAAYGVSDVTHPCFDAVAGTVCTPQEALERAYFDGVHPNSVLHADLAGLVRAEIAPVPLPGPMLLLLAGMAGLAATGARRRG